LSNELRRIYQLKVTLKDSKPPIWRRIIVQDSVLLSEFHEILQIVMGWEDTHLHLFIANGRFYGVPGHNPGLTEILDESKFRLNELLKKVKESIIYEYDLGDSWKHKVTLEKIIPYDPAIAVPKCIKAKGACPPEDVGGIWGYYDFLEAINDPSHPEHDEYKEWVGGEFDPSEYDIEEVNKLLSEYFSG